MIKICFVCTGNTCRSIMAERLMKKVVKENNILELKVSSRGICATGENINPCAKSVLKKLHASGANRKSVKLGKIDKNTLYITMTEQQKQFINSQKVISFRSLIGKDIADPHGQEEGVYFETAKDILNGVNKLIEKLKIWRWLNDNIGQWPCGVFA